MHSLQSGYQSSWQPFHFQLWRAWAGKVGKVSGKKMSGGTWGQQQAKLGEKTPPCQTSSYNITKPTMKGLCCRRTSAKAAFALPHNPCQHLARQHRGPTPCRNKPGCSDSLSPGPYGNKPLCIGTHSKIHLNAASKWITSIA